MSDVKEQPEAPEDPWDKVVGRIHPHREPVEMMFRNVVGYADLAGAGILFFFPKNYGSRVMMPKISDETSIEQLLMAREFLTATINKAIQFRPAPMPPPPPKEDA